jgi:hypothetical protein
MTPRKRSEKKESIKVEHESQLHLQLGIPMKKLAKTGLIVKKQQKLNELAAKEEQRLKDLASFIRDDSSPPPRLHTASSLRK